MVDRLEARDEIILGLLGLQKGSSGRRSCQYCLSKEITYTKQTRLEYTQILRMEYRLKN